MQIRKVTLKGDRVKVVNWMRSGAPLKEGVSLYASLFPDPDFLRQIKKNPEINRERLYMAFCEMMDISYQKFTTIVNENHGKRSKTNTPGGGRKSGDKPTETTAKIKSGRSFRNDYPFLSNVDCPPELKILAADKLSCHERYTKAHEQLFDCATLDECHKTAYTLIENFKENRQIYDELDYFKQHGAILGKHSIFDQFKRFEKLKGLNVIQLVELYKQTLPHRIWRIESEIKKGDKPHLMGEREKRLKEVQAELAEVKRLLGING